MNIQYTVGGIIGGVVGFLLAVLLVGTTLLPAAPGLEKCETTKDGLWAAKYDEERRRYCGYTTNIMLAVGAVPISICSFLGVGVQMTLDKKSDHAI